ncbi:hypothetical protein [Legionella sp. CNM-4043-24]|uniref:hypothetical protein n=1 Tax=Legionella sp. CNM-4043-24 TaxID=3421646 RepID=UPI00403B2DD9
MQSTNRYLLPGLLLAVSSAVFADDPADQGVVTDPGAPPVTNTSNSDAANLTVYLQNLGKYFGYDLTQYCTTGGSCSSNSQSGGNSGSGSGSGNSSDFSNTLLNPRITSGAQLGLFNSYLGSLLGASSSSPLVPSDFPKYSQINNSLAGESFTYQNYSTASPQNVSVSPIIDQQSYQTDPVSQAVLNLLATPDSSYCQFNNSAPSCQPPFFREQIMINVAGPLNQLATDVVFTPAQNIPLVPQLNIDTLLTPLMYTPSSADSSGSKTSTPTIGLATDSSPPGLTAQTQAQQAMNFIRYATSAVNTLPLPTRSTYSALFDQASNASKNVSPADQANAQVQIASYITQLRTVAAQNSVAVSNLYYALSRRLPQDNGNAINQENPGMSASGDSTVSSEAMNEFIMASWRLYNPAAGSDNKNQQQWLTKINQGSAASVQKEIAVLLAEINYQLYLTRQQQERLLITQSMIMLQNTKMMPLSPSMGATSGGTDTSDASTAATTLQSGQ